MSTKQPRTKRGRFRRRWRRASRVQSLEFSRARFTPRAARRWATGHGFKATKTDVRPATIRVRQEPPARFSKYASKRITTGVRAIVAEPKPRKRRK